MTKKYNLIPSNWITLSEELSKPFENFDDIRQFLAFSSGNINLDLMGVEHLKDSIDVLSIFNFVRSQSLRIQELFPNSHVDIMDQNINFSIEFSREQILVLLCHMTLLTFKPNSSHIYWVTFENWLSDGRPCAMAYLRGLFSYFIQAESKLNSEWSSEIITFERRTCSDSIFPLPSIKFKPVELHLTGSISDFSRNVIDFANQHIGFGISGTQEEVIFGSFIELCPSMIFCCNAMKDDESIVAKNVLKYASYSGYGFELKFIVDVSLSSSYNVIAIDALDFSGDYHNAYELQLKRQNLERELRKLIAGFSVFRNEMIDTGNWGCGAFGGNKYIKALLQMIAATYTGNTLSFCCFSDEDFHNSFKIFLSKLDDNIDEIWNALLSIDPILTTNLDFDVILKILKNKENHH